MLIPLTDTDLFPFGKHKGKQMQEVPAGYLDWLQDQNWLREKWPAVADYIEANRTAIDWELDHPGER